MAFLYLHRRNDTQDVFYIGIGLTNDPNHKRAYEKGNRRNNYWQNIVNKVGYFVIILQDNITPKEAKNMEISMIKYYGRENLTNNTDGGDGTLGNIKSEETINKIKEKRKLQVFSEETKAKMSATRKGKSTKKKGKKQGPMSDEAKAKISKATKGENNPMFGKSSRPICPVLQDLRRAKISASLKANKLKKDNKL